MALDSILKGRRGEAPASMSASTFSIGEKRGQIQKMTSCACFSLDSPFFFFSFLFYVCVLFKPREILSFSMHPGGNKFGLEIA